MSPIELSLLLLGLGFGLISGSIITSVIMVHHNRKVVDKFMRLVHVDVIRTNEALENTLSILNTTTPKINGSL